MILLLGSCLFLRKSILWSGIKLEDMNLMFDWCKTYMVNSFYCKILEIFPKDWIECKQIFLTKYLNFQWPLKH